MSTTMKWQSNTKIAFESYVTTVINTVVYIVESTIFKLRAFKKNIYIYPKDNYIPVNKKRIYILCAYNKNKEKNIYN